MQLTWWQILLGIAFLCFCLWLMISSNKQIKKVWETFRMHAADIAGIRTPLDFIDKRHELNDLMKDVFFMGKYGRNGELYYILDEMMDRKYWAIMKDVEEIAEGRFDKKSSKEFEESGKKN